MASRRELSLQRDPYDPAGRGARACVRVGTVGGSCAWGAPLQRTVTAFAFAVCATAVCGNRRRQLWPASCRMRYLQQGDERGREGADRTVRIQSGNSRLALAFTPAALLFRVDDACEAAPYAWVCLRRAPLAGGRVRSLRPEH